MMRLSLPFKPSVARTGPVFSAVAVCASLGLLASVLAGCSDKAADASAPPAATAPSVAAAPPAPSPSSATAPGADPAAQASAAPAPATVESDASGLASLTTSMDQVHYRNDYFGLEVRKPDGWFVQDTAALMKTSAQGIDAMLEDRKAKAAMLQQSLKKTTPLFSFFSQKPDKSAQNMANVAAVAENIEGQVQVKTGCDYLDRVRELLENSEMPMAVTPGCQTKRVGKVNFGYMDVRPGGEDSEVRQRYWACLTRTHAIGVVQTTTDTTGVKAIEELFKTFKVGCVEG